jgi:cold shock CspA family protein
MSSSTTEQRALARVKWFNNKSGFGFVTVTDGPHNGRDIFVHHSAIGVLSQQYKYLVEGEYIELFVLPSQTGAHEFQAANVCGVNGGKLMCETRNEARNKPKPPAKQEQKQEQEQQQKQEQVVEQKQDDWKIASKNVESGVRGAEGGRGRGGRGSKGGRGTGRGSGGRGRGKEGAK